MRKDRPAIQQLVYWNSRKCKKFTYTNQSRMGDINLAFAKGSRGRHRDREVLIWGQVLFVVHGVERPVV